MYNHADTPVLKLRTMVGGLSIFDKDTHHTLYAGIDPAEPKRFLIRKLVQVNKTTYCVEETRITPAETVRKPTIHTQLFRIKDFDLHEKLTPEELQIRGSFRPIPNVLGFSLFFR